MVVSPAKGVRDAIFYGFPIRHQCTLRFNELPKAPEKGNLEPKARAAKSRPFS